MALVHPDGSETRYDHDPAGRLVGLEHPVAGQARFERDAAGRLVGLHATGLSRSWRYAEDRLVGYEERAGAAVTTVAIRRDAAGRVVEVTGADGEQVERFAYDPAGQLVEAAGAEGTWRFRYDAAGRLVAEDGPEGAATYAYDAAHQLTTVERQGVVTRFSYDGAGRRLAEETEAASRRFAFDGYGRLAGVETVGADGPSSTPLLVDAFGDLAEVGGTPLAWDPIGAYPRLCQLGAATVVSSGEVAALAVVEGDAVSWLGADWLGSVGGGFDPWGHRRGHQDPLAIGYRGELAVDGLVWLRQRAYDPATRTFLSPDPLAAGPGGPTTPYHYAANDPIGHLDPLGLRPLNDAELKKLQAARKRSVWERIAGVADDLWDATGGLAVSFVNDNPWLGTVAMAAVGTALIVIPGAGTAVGVSVLASLGADWLLSRPRRARSTGTRPRSRGRPVGVVVSRHQL